MVVNESKEPKNTTVSSCYAALAQGRQKARSSIRRKNSVDTNDDRLELHQTQRSALPDSERQVAAANQPSDARRPARGWLGSHLAASIGTIGSGRHFTSHLALCLLGQSHPVTGVCTPAEMAGSCGEARLGPVRDRRPNSWKYDLCVFSFSLRKGTDEPRLYPLLPVFSSIISPWDVIRSRVLDKPD